MHQYEKDGPAIYRQSFATIRAEADLAGLPADVSQVAVRMIHACGMVDLVRDLAFSPNAVADARAALRAGAPILCDVAMVASGVTRKRLPADNDVVCTLSDPSVPELAAKMGTTRSAAALELWRDRMEGAVVAVGNAPTALFRLLEMIEEGRPAPGRRHRRPGRLRRRDGVEGGPGRAPVGPGTPDRPRQARRQRDSGGGAQRHRERGRVVTTPAKDTGTGSTGSGSAPATRT